MINKPAYEPSARSFPSNVHDECDAIRHVARGLRGYAAAAYTLGQHTFSEQLAEYAELLDTAHGAIRDHVHQRIDSDFRSAQEMSAAMLDAVVAGAKLAESRKST